MNIEILRTPFHFLPHFWYPSVGRVFRPVRYSKKQRAQTKKQLENQMMVIELKTILSGHVEKISGLKIRAIDDFLSEF